MDIVSVIIPTFKNDNTLFKAIDSVLNQSYRFLEVIVVDDNDPQSVYRQKTEDIINYYMSETRLKYIQHEKNMNGSAARNTGLKHSIGSYVLFLDDDDSLYPTMIEKLCLFIKLNNSDAVYCDYRKDNIDMRLTHKNDFSFDILCGNKTPQTSCILFKASLVHELNGFDESYIRHQDYEFLLRFYQKFKIDKVNEVLVLRDKGNFSNIPNPEKLKNVKIMLLSQFEYVIKDIVKKKPNARRIIRAANFIQLSILYFKNKKFYKSIKYLLISLTNSPLTTLKKIITIGGQKIEQRKKKKL